MTTLILVLADQLTPGLASLRDLDPADAVVLMAEVREECTYVRHHKKKIAFLFSAMRHFAGELRAAGWTVDYVTLDAPGQYAELRRRAAPRARAPPADLKCGWSSRESTALTR